MMENFGLYVLIALGVVLVIAGAAGLWFERKQVFIVDEDDFDGRL